MPPRVADQNLREALARLAAQDLDQVISEARAEARERVRGILVDALAEEMLSQAEGKTKRAPQPAAPQPAARQPDTDTPKPKTSTPKPQADTAESQAAAPTPKPSPSADLGTGLYVFCIVGSDAVLPSDLEGLEPNTKVRLIPHGNLAAATTEVALNDFDGEQLRENLNDLRWLEHTARSHEAVLDAIGSHQTLVPMRLITIYRNEAGVTEMLSREAPALSEALERLEGKSEWGVKVFASGEPLAAAAATTANGSGVDYMRQRQSDREQRKNAAQQQHDACVEIHGRLSAAAAEAMTQPPQRAEVSGHSGAMVLNGVYLIENERREEFLALVDALQDEHRDEGFEFEPTGPWPAYNFVPSEIGAAA